MDAPFPAPYDRWIREALGALPQDESKATCGSCAMCRPPPSATWSFLPDAKCCTYVPDLPSFRAGSVLRDTSAGNASGRAAVEARIDARIGVTPLGLFRTFQEEQRYAALGERFGRTKELLCPFFRTETNDCGIHAHRNAVCTTYHCKHDRGAVGLAAWGAIFEVLQLAEIQVAQWCARELGLAPDTLRVALGRIGERVLPDGSLGAAQAVWGTWLGREREWFTKAAELVDALGWDDVLRLAGPEVAARADHARAAHARLDAGIPEALTLRGWQVISVGDDGQVATTHSGLDPIGLAAPLLTVLHYFDGRPTKDALAAMESDRGIALDEALLRSLVDWGIVR